MTVFKVSKSARFVTIEKLFLRKTLSRDPGYPIVKLKYPSDEKNIPVMKNSEIIKKVNLGYESLRFSDKKLPDLEKAHIWKNPHRRWPIVVPAVGGL